MNLPFSEYLSPTNPIASGIVTGLQILFVVWFAILLGCWWRLTGRKRQISKNEDVQPLVDARQKRDSGRDENQRKGSAETTSVNSASRNPSLKVRRLRNISKRFSYRVGLKATLRSAS